MVHSSLLERVLKAPINLFFDVTPIGKILNRFSNDLNVLDGSLMDSICHFIGMLVNAVKIIAVISLASK